MGKIIRGELGQCNKESVYGFFKSNVCIHLAALLSNHP